MTANTSTSILEQDNIKPNSELDLFTLEKYLSGKLPEFAGPIQATKFANGQSNPTFLLSTPNQQYVLRRKPAGELLKSAHAVDREYRVLNSLNNTDVPVAEVYLYCEDDSILGSPFYIMEYMQGRVFWDPALPELSNEERAQVYSEMNRVLAAIHNVDLNTTELSDYGRPGNYYERQISRWSQQYQASVTEHIPEMDALMAWLPENTPVDDGVSTLIHGDYRLDNLMFAPDRLEVIAVFDWELSTLGHPLADLAYQIMQRFMGRDWHIQGLAGLDPLALGIPLEQNYINTYCQHRNIKSIEDWPFYLAFSFFRFSAICQGVQARAQQGNASSNDAERVGAMTRPLAALGHRVIS